MLKKGQPNKFMRNFENRVEMVRRRRAREAAGPDARLEAFEQNITTRVTATVFARLQSIHKAFHALDGRASFSATVRDVIEAGIASLMGKDNAGRNKKER